MEKNKSSIYLIKQYQKNKTTSGRCKHIPSCSNYSIECYQKFNFFKATFLTIKRIICCNPLTKKIYDPVPLSKKEKKEKLKNINKTLQTNKVLFDELINKNYEISYVVSLIWKDSFSNKNITNSDIDNYYFKLDTYIYLVKIKKINKNYQKTVQLIYTYIFDSKFDIPNERR